MRTICLKKDKLTANINICMLYTYFYPAAVSTLNTDAVAIAVCAILYGIY